MKSRISIASLLLWLSLPLASQLVQKNADILFTELQKRGVFVMPSGKPGFMRVSHMGCDTIQDLDELAQMIVEIENL